MRTSSGYDVSESDIRSALAPAFGEVDSVNLVVDYTTGRHRGFAFVQFQTAEAADLACRIQTYTIKGKHGII